MGEGVAGALEARAVPAYRIGLVGAAAPLRLRRIHPGFGLASSPNPYRVPDRLHPELHFGHAVLDCVEANLDSDLSLPVLARVACFSGYHFHRIFVGVVGEPPARFIQRVRLERAATRLCVDSDLTVTEVALDAHFSNPAAFSGAFRAQFGMRATDWRKENRKIGKAGGNGSKASARAMLHAQGNRKVPRWRFPMSDSDSLDVQVRRLDKLHLAYVRHIGPYAGDAELFERLIGRLMAWAGPRDLLNPDTLMLSIYHDNPEVTAPDKLRLGMCITVPEATKPEGEIGRMDLPAGRYAMARIAITSPEQYSKA